MRQSLANDLAPAGNTPSASAAILRLVNLRKVREQGDVRFELQAPDLSLHAGQFVAVVGASGCGKSTLLDILAMVMKPSHCDEFWWANRHQTNAKVNVWDIWNSGAEHRLAEIRRRDLGYVLQTGGLMPFLSVADNIRLPMRILKDEADQTTLVNLAQRIGIDAVLSKKPQHLSGGQRQRAAILRALIHNPRLILADEPTAAVDKERAREIVQDFKALAQDRGTTIVMVTHDHDLVRPLADVTYTFDVARHSDTEVRSVCRLQ